MKMFEVNNKRIDLTLFLWVILPFAASLFLSIYININITRNIIPQGDPYTYLNSWIDITRSLQYPKNFNEISVIWTQLSGSNWYWTQNLGYYLVHPIIKNDPLSFFYVNYIFCLIAGISIYFYARKVFVNRLSQLISASIPVIIPGTHGTLHYTSLDVSSLDSIFLNLLISLIFIHLNLAEGKISERKFKGLPIFFAAGVVNILTIWARGNSLFQIVFLILPIFILYLRKIHINQLKTYRDMFLLLNISLYSLMTFFGYYIYSKIQGDNIQKYYGVHSRVYGDVLEKNFRIIEVTNFIFKAPGALVTHNRSLILTVISSCLLYFLILFVFFAETIRNKSPKLNSNMILTRLMFFYIVAILTLNILLFTGIEEGPLSYFQQSLMSGALIIWNPVLIVFSLLIFYVLGKLKIGKSEFRIIAGTMALILLIQGFVNTKNESNGSKISREELESFSLKLPTQAENKPVKYCSFYYEGDFNAPLLNYFRKINNVIPISVYNSSVLWDQEKIINPETSKFLKDGLIESFNICDYFFVPSKLSMWNQDNPYQLYKAPKLFDQELKNQKDLVLVSRTFLKTDSYILLLKKISEKQN